MPNHIGDTSITKAERFGKGDGHHVRAQRVWLILVAHVMAPELPLLRGHLRGPFKPTNPRILDKRLITYGELAEIMGEEDRHAARRASIAVGFVARYCRLNDLPMLNCIVVGKEEGPEKTREPGDRALTRDGKTFQQEQYDVVKTDWFKLRVPTVEAFRKANE